MDDRDDMLFDRRTWFIIMAMLAALGFSIAYNNLSARRSHKPEKRLSYFHSPAENPTARYLSESGSQAVYVDERPFGSLDYVEDASSGEMIKREPTKKDYETFSRLEKEAIEKGILEK